MTGKPLPHEGLHATGRSLRGPRALLVACVLLYALCRPAYADPRPAWPTSYQVDGSEQSFESSFRYTFILPKRHPFCLVELPSRNANGTYPQHYAVRFGEKWLAFRMVHAGEEKTALLIDATQALGGDTIEIYPLGSGDSPMPDSPRPSVDSASPDFWIVRAPQPIGGEFCRGNFVTDPLPPDVLATPQAGLLRRNGGNERFMARNFEAACAQTRNLRHERRGMPFADGITDLVTWLYVDKPGTYVFAIRGYGASRLSMGAEETPVASSYMPYPAGRRHDPSIETKWSLGQELTLEPGVYRLHAENYYLYEPSLSIGWLRPGATDIEELPVADLLSGQDSLPPLRAEPRDADLVVGLRTRLTTPYAFAGHTNVFVTCTVTPRLNLWAPKPADEQAEGQADKPKPRPVYSWTVDGTPAGETEGALATILANGPHEIAVSATHYGHTASATTTVHVQGLPEKEFLVAAQERGDDILRPDLWITGDFNPPVSVDATLRVHLCDGSVRTYTNAVALVQNWARLEGAPLPVADVASLSWDLRHGSIVLASDTCVLQRPPFPVAPSSLVGSILRTPDGNSVAYVLPRAPGQTGANGLAEGHGQVEGHTWPDILLGDCLFPSAATTNDLAALCDAFGPSIRHIRPATLRHDAGESLTDIAALCGLDAIPEGSSVVLCLGTEAILARLSPEEYEREVMAIALLLRDARHARVTVATPPPFGDAPVPVRPYATAALRAAALCGLPTADLYSAFQTRATGSEPLVQGFRVTPAGLRRAAETISRKR